MEFSWKSNCTTIFFLLNQWWNHIFRALNLLIWTTEKRFQALQNDIIHNCTSIIYSYSSLHLQIHIHSYSYSWMLKMYTNFTMKNAEKGKEIERSLLPAEWWTIKWSRWNLSETTPHNMLLAQIEWGIFYPLWQLFMQRCHRKKLCFDFQCFWCLITSIRNLLTSKK